jgi:hypothetical protein
VKICNKKKYFFASETNTFHISYEESKNEDINKYEISTEFGKLFYKLNSIIK